MSMIRGSVLPWLFKPQPQVIAAMQPYLAEFESQPIVGVQVRRSSFMTSVNKSYEEKKQGKLDGYVVVSDSDMDALIECSRAVADGVPRKHASATELGQPSKFFLVTDDPTVRAQLSMALGAERLIHIDTIPIHFADESATSGHLSVFLDWYLFSRVDIGIINARSSFAETSFGQRLMSPINSHDCKFSYRYPVWEACSCPGRSDWRASVRDTDTVNLYNPQDAEIIGSF